MRVHPTSYKEDKKLQHITHTMSTITSTTPSIDITTTTLNEVRDNILGPNAWGYDELRQRITSNDLFYRYAYAASSVYRELAYRTDGRDDDAVHIAYYSISDALYNIKGYSDDNIRVLADAFQARYTIAHSVTVSYLSGLPEGEGETLLIDLRNNFLIDFEEEIKRNIRKARRIRNYVVEVMPDSMELDENAFQRKAAIYGVAMLNVIGERVKDYGRPIEYLAYAGVKEYVATMIDPFSMKEECIKAIEKATEMTVSLLSI